MNIEKIAINVNNRDIDVFTDDISFEQIKLVLKELSKLTMFEIDEIKIHNKNQTTDLINVYDGNVIIDNLYKVNNE